MKKRKKKKTNVWKKLSHAIMYLSDLFVFLMVAAWIYVLVILSFAALYSMFKNGDTSIFTLLQEAAVLPLSVGGAIWLIRCAINHHNATRRGEHADYDFPNLEEDGTVTETEKESVSNDEDRLEA